MIDLKVNKKNVREDSGIVYVVEIYFEDEGPLVKIGVTTKSKPEERWNQFANSIWKHYRKFYAMYPKRYRKADEIYKKEKVLLDYFKEYQCSPNKQVDGHTEMHRVPLDIVASTYDKIMNGEALDSSTEKCEVCGKEKKFDGKCAFKCEDMLDSDVESK